MHNSLKVELPCLSENESIARAVVASFAALLNPTISELDDIKTAVSEAVTNAIVHAYKNTCGSVHICCSLIGNTMTVSVRDEGVGISDISLARKPLYTSDTTAERSGLGFTVMETFMDRVEVISHPGEGTTVVMFKTIQCETEDSSVCTEVS